MRPQRSKYHSAIHWVEMLLRLLVEAVARDYSCSSEELHTTGSSFVSNYLVEEFEALFLVNPTPSPTPSAIPKMTRAINATNNQKTAPRRLLLDFFSGSFSVFASNPASPRPAARPPGTPASFNVSSSLLPPGDRGKLPVRVPVSGASELSLLSSSRSLVPGDPSCGTDQYCSRGS